VRQTRGRQTTPAFPRPARRTHQPPGGEDGEPRRALRGHGRRWTGVAEHATFYVQVDDPQAALDQIEKLGGQTIMPVMAVPGGPTIAMFTDPEGNRVGLVKGGTMQ
jgi:hypothetical protein